MPPVSKKGVPKSNKTSTEYTLNLMQQYRFDDNIKTRIIFEDESNIQIAPGTENVGQTNRSKVICNKKHNMTKGLCKKKPDKVSKKSNKNASKTMNGAEVFSKIESKVKKNKKSNEKKEKKKLEDQIKLQNETVKSFLNTKNNTKDIHTNVSCKTVTQNDINMQTNTLPKLFQANEIVNIHSNLEELELNINDESGTDLICIIDELSNLSNNTGRALLCPPDLSITEKINNMQVVQQSNNYNINQQESVISNKTYVQNQTDSSYIFSVLLEIVDNLIEIIPYLDNYFTILHFEKYDHLAINKAERNLADAKLKYFSLSYVSIVLVILPKKDDREFLRNIVLHVLKIAENKGLLENTRKTVALLMKQNIIWADKKHEQSMNFRNQSQLNNNKKLPISTSTSSNYQNRRASVISYEASKQTLQQPNDTVNPIVTMTTPTSIINLSNMPHLQPNPAYLVPTNYVRTENTSMLPSYNDTVARLREVRSGKETYNKLNPQNRNGSNMYPNLRNILERESQQILNSNANPIPNAATAPILNAEKHSTFQDRSSVSRDSGFISPMNEGNNLDVFLSHHSEVESGFPNILITHVTSLNPEAVQSSVHACIVCNDPTKLRCLGCNKTYYCSTICQHNDWKRHYYQCHSTSKL